MTFSKGKVTKKLAYQLLSTYWHVQSGIDGHYYRGSWGYTHCSNPQPEGRIYFQTWVLTPLYMQIKDLGIIDDTVRIENSKYMPGKAFTIRETPVGINRGGQ